MQFRASLSIRPFTPNETGRGIVYTDGQTEARTPIELQKLYVRHGATEVYACIGTKRYDNADGKDNLHTLQRGLVCARLAAELNLPLNPELGLFAIYGDMMGQPGPDFSEYPELPTLHLPWNELPLQDMCVVLEAYGRLVAQEILSTGAKVNVWDIGNETNFGVAGVAAGQKVDRVNPEIGCMKQSSLYARPHFGAGWLANNVWLHNAAMFRAVAQGIRTVDPSARFSTHITTAIGDMAAVLRFQTMADHGYRVDEVGLSFYPTCFWLPRDRFARFRRIVSAVTDRLNLPVFVAETGYPSETMKSGEYAGWSHATPGYPLSEQGQAAFLQELCAWGNGNGLSGVRPWAPDFLKPEWAEMAFFRQAGNVAIAKPALDSMQQGMNQ